MIDLPSTTKVERKIPKERFYEQLKLTGKQRELFVRLVEAIIIKNSIKPSTMHIREGKIVNEIFLLEVILREKIVPAEIAEIIAKVNPHKILFRCVYDGFELYLVLRQGKIWNTKWMESSQTPRSALKGEDLDTIWDSICSQVIFDDDSISDVDNEIVRQQKLIALETEIRKLELAHGKECQLGKRNVLFEKLQMARRNRDSLLKG